MDIGFKTVMMKAKDHVAVALENIPSGSEVIVTCQDQVFKLILADTIEFGHKFAVKPLLAGEDIFKYGEVIGRAVQDITIGQHVHIHNLEGLRGRGDLDGQDN